ncbi:MAG: preprotein translocase subunit SecG [Crocinitomicaceae bacterium]
MLGVIYTLIIIASVLLILVILMQNPKGGGFSTDFGSASQLGGVRRASDFLEKASWSLATFIVVLALISPMWLPTTGEVQETETEGGAAPIQQGAPTGNQIPTE